MLIAKLTISYDRGLARNVEKDLTEGEVNIFGRGMETKDGKVIRGLGTHFRSKADADQVGERDKEARRIYKAFRERFLTTPIDGLYAVPTKGLAKAFLETLQPQLGLKVRVTEFELSTSGDMDAAAVLEWAERIKRQLNGVSFGRKKGEIDAEGLRVLEVLADGPVLSEQTASQIRNLVAAVQAQRIDRVELKRSLDNLTVQIDMTQLKPRRTPKLAEVA